MTWDRLVVRVVRTASSVRASGADKGDGDDDEASAGSRSRGRSAASQSSNDENVSRPNCSGGTTWVGCHGSRDPVQTPRDQNSTTAKEDAPADETSEGETCETPSPCMDGPS
jgi:hypothetical protein